MINFTLHIEIRRIMVRLKRQNMKFSIDKIKTDIRFYAQRKTQTLIVPRILNRIYF